MALCGDAAVSFDAAVHSALSQLTGIRIDASQWEQAGFALRDGGLGLRPAVAAADAAYLASRSVTHARCLALRVGHRWDGHIPGSWIAEATARCNSCIHAAGIEDLISCASADAGLSQSAITKRVDAARVCLWEQSVSAASRCRRRAYAGPTAGRVLVATPSKTLDKHLSNAEFSLEISLRLGVDVFEGGLPCPFCGLLLDSSGHHAMSCMAGGDAVLAHNSVRDLVHDFCRRGRLRPELEAGGLLRELSLPEGRRRPADVLLCGPSCLPARLPDGARIPSSHRVALDFAVINAHGQSHWKTTFESDGTAAARAYGDRKRQHHDTAARCQAAGICFQPLVLTAQGTIAAEGSWVLHCIAEAVSITEGSCAASVFDDLLERLAVVVARANYRAVARAACALTALMPLLRALLFCYCCRCFAA